MSYELDGTETPWSYCELANDDGHVRYSVEGRSGEEICVIDCDDHTAECDARAIAAVPELIGVLAGIVERWDSLVPEEEVSEEHKQARAALAKATGETNEQ